MNWFILFLIMFIVFIFLIIVVYNKLLEIRNEFNKDIKRMKDNLKSRVSTLIELMEDTAIYANFDDRDKKALLDFRTQINSANNIDQLKAINEAVKNIRISILSSLKSSLDSGDFTEIEGLRDLLAKLDDLENSFSSIVYDVNKLEEKYKRILRNPIFFILGKLSFKNDNSMFDRELSTTARK